MDRAYWEKIAPGYNDEIFDVLKNDRKKIITGTLRKLASDRKTVCDLGCAIGKWLPLLSPLFKKVVAIDISAENLRIAKELYPDLKNIEYKRADLSSESATLPGCDVAVCINAVLTDKQEWRTRFFKNLGKAVKKNGSLLLVVPSLESYMLSSIIRQRWDPDKDAGTMINKQKGTEQYQNMLQGNAEIDEVPTKHYLKEELQILLNHAGFAIREIHKIEYPWDTEFLNPPSWLSQPQPWDWMLLCKKL